ncbi:MAG TPA: hypothetical protein VMN39_04565, partial [Longimicrobiaceae bacterium]|nr:hypothetical protein [Longimicrobiaceae bacterium]
ERICRVLETLEPESILLLGSAARGELTHRRREDGRLELFSDLELACVVGRRRSTLETRVREELERVERDIAVDNGLFHVDCMIVTELPTGTESRGLLWYESGVTAVPLAGSSGRNAFGEVVPERVSMGLVNALVTIRLWWLLIEFPVALLARPGTELSDPRREVFLYALMRNLLDVPSIWLPNEGVFIPSYAGRLDYLTEHWEEIGGHRWFDDSVRRGLADATRAKLTADIEGDPVVWYGIVVRAYRGLLRRLLTLDPAAGEGEVQEAILDWWAATHPAPRSWRFRLYRLALGLRTMLRPGAGLRWLRRRRAAPAAALAFLHAMHGAALHRLENGSAEPDLTAARDSLWRFTGVRAATRGGRSFAAEWHRLREAFIDEFIRQHRTVRGRRQAIRTLMTTEKNGLE